MQEDIAQIIENTKADMNKAIAHFESELAKIRAGQVTPDILSGIFVPYYGNPTPIQQVANINVVDSRTLSIKPWEKHLIQEVERAILAANIGITPQNDGEQIRLFMPPVTEESRRELVKRSLAQGEQAKISIRTIRKDAMDAIKKLQKDNLSEDQAKSAESDIQQLTDSFSNKVDQYCASKEKQIMTV